jgi:hypothetical protein
MQCDLFIFSKKIVDFDAISRLIKVLKEVSPNLQEKICSVLEHLAAFEEHATAMTAASIGSVIEVVLEMGVIYGTSFYTWIRNSDA